MIKQYSRVCAEVDLDAFIKNLDEIKRVIRPQTGVVAVIKTNGYGHGAVALASVLEQREEIKGYAVATCMEACQLQDAGYKKPILILGYVFPEDYEVLVTRSIRSAVFNLEMAQKLNEEAEKQGKVHPIHIKLDTGMSRIGFQVTEESAEIIAEIAGLSHIKVEGIFTHFAKADEFDKSFTAAQVERYDRMIQMLGDRQVEIPIHHVSNSAGIVELQSYNKDLVRAGIILYGLWPSDEVNQSLINLKPLMTLRSHVVHVKDLEDGRTISYGGTYRVEDMKRIATIPVGYGDGYPRTLSGKGYVLIHGQKAPICGRVCMDQFMVDVTEISGVNVGDEVVLIGTQGNEQITMEFLGDLSGRFNYELACDIGVRVPRRYWRNGECLEHLTMFG